MFTGCVLVTKLVTLKRLDDLLYFSLSERISVRFGISSCLEADPSILTLYQPFV